MSDEAHTAGSRSHAGARTRRRATKPTPRARNRVRSGSRPARPRGNGQKLAPRGDEGPTDVQVPAQPPFPTLVAWAAACLLIFAAGTGAGYGLSAIQDPVYGAEADILYRVADGSGARAERDLATQQVVLQGRAVLQPVADEAQMPVEDLQELLSVEVVGQSDVLRITMEHRDPALAVQLARDISDHYVRTVAAAQDEAASFVEEQSAELAAALGDVEQELVDLQEEDDDAVGDTPDERRLQAEAERLRLRIAGLETLLAGAGAATPGGAEIRVLTPAYLLDEPLAPRPVRAAVAGGIAALVVIAALGAVLARRWGYA